MAAPASDLLSHFWLLDFSSETAERNSTKLDRKQDLNAIYQGSVFRAGRKNKMAAPASDWLRHFRLLISERNSKKLDRKQDLNVLYQVHVFFSWSIWKKRWPHRPLICRDIFDFSSKTAEPNPTKLDRKQDLNVIYQVCVFFRADRDRKNKMATRPLICCDIFDFSSETTEQNSTKLVRKQDLNVLCQVCVFRADRKNKMATRPLIEWDIFDFSSWTEFNEAWQGARSLNILYQFLCFSGRSEK